MSPALNPEVELKWISPDKKYMVVFYKDGSMQAFRYGLAWRTLVGDKLILSMLQSLCAVRDSVHVTCGCGQAMVNSISGKTDDLWICPNPNCKPGQVNLDFKEVQSC